MKQEGKTFLYTFYDIKKIKLGLRKQNYWIDIYYCFINFLSATASEVSPKHLSITSLFEAVAESSRHVVEPG